MKRKKDFEIVNIADDYMAVPVGDQVSEFSGTVVLNDVSAFLLETLNKPCTIDDLVTAVLETYEIDEATARTDIENTVKQMMDIGLIEE